MCHHQKVFFCRKTLRKTDRRHRSNSNLDLNRNFISQYCFVEFVFKFFDKTVNKGDFLRIISLYKFAIFSYYEGNEILSSFVYSFHFHTSQTHSMYCAPFLLPPIISGRFCLSKNTQAFTSILVYLPTTYVYLVNKLLVHTLMLIYDSRTHFWL